MALQTCLKADHSISYADTRGAIHSNKISDREKWSTSKGGPVFSKLFWLDRTDPLSLGPKFPEFLVERIPPQVPRRSKKHALRTVQFVNFVASHRTLGVLRAKMASSSNQEEGKASRKHGFYVDDCFADTLK